MQTLKFWLRNYWIECIGILILFGSFLSHVGKTDSVSTKFFLFSLLIILSVFTLWSSHKFFGKNQTVSLEDQDNISIDDNHQEETLLLAKALKTLNGDDPIKAKEHIRLLIQSEHRHKGEPIPSGPILDEMVNSLYKSLNQKNKSNI